MKTKGNGILTLLLAFVVHLTFAQEKTISGTVTDQDGLPLPGVNIVVVGSSTGTQTDFDGNYSIKANANQSLLFRYLGQKDVTKEIGSSNVMNVQMFEDAQALQEVVVTALGIEIDRAKLASSIAKVDAADVVKSGETSIIQGLSGKAAGVNISTTSGEAGASAYIQIRGQSTITRSLQPLIVIDGIPVSNDEIGNGVDGVTQQSRLGDINPNDIADVQILKGASAAAIWGSRAGNGVIVITTKKGKGNGDGVFKINYTSTYSYDKPNARLKTQNVFGKGDDGVYSSGTTGNSWGDKISVRTGGTDEVNEASGTYFVSENGNTYYPLITKNSTANYNDSNYDAVINSGHYIDNNLSLSTANKNGNFYMSVSNLKQNGIIINNDYNRTTARFNAEVRMSSKVKMKGTMSYSKIESNRIQTGSNLSGLLLGLYRSPADFDNRDYIGTIVNNGVETTGAHRAYRRELGIAGNPIYNNPLWTTNVQKNPNDVNRYISGLEFQYKASDWLTLIARGGLDHYTDERKGIFPKYSAENAGGGYVAEEYYSSTQTNIDFIARGNIKLTEKLGFDYLAGLNYNKRIFDAREGSYQNFLLDSDKVFYGNSVIADRTTAIDESEVRVSAGYATTSFDYDNILFLTLTARAETASTFGDNAVFYYPSAEFGFQFNRLTGLADSKLSNGKLRLTYGEVGQEPAAYATTTYVQTAADTEGWGAGYSSSAYNGSYSRSGTQGNENLEPERKKEFEIGVDLGFFDNRFTVSSTYYNNETKGALFTVSRPGTTGYSGLYSNAADLTNTGFEIDFGFDVIRKPNFKWNIFGNWSTYDNEVTNLSGTNFLFLAGFTGVSSGAVEGQPVGVLWGGKFDRNADNSLILDDNGFPTVAQNEGVLGDPNPDWRGGLGTSITYKNFTISTLFDASIGGDVWDGTNGALNVFGRTPETAIETNLSAADAAVITNYNGVSVDQLSYANLNNDGSYTVRGNLTDFGNGDVLLDQEWYSGLGGGFGPVGEQFIKDASWVKWRELTLAYRFAPEAIKQATGIENIELSVTGRNLWYWSKDDFGQDPETNLTGGSNGRGLQYFNSPNTKSYVMSLKLNF